MKKQEKEETPLLYIERSPLTGLISTGLAAFFIYWTYLLLKDVNPVGFMMLIPSGFFVFQTIWLYLNPFAAFFDERLEIRQSLFHHQQRFFIDIKAVTEDGEGHVYITYNDDEVEKLNLFGIGRSGIRTLRENITRQIALKANQPAA